MKKILITCTVFIMLAGCTSAFAADFSLGLATWYADWKFEDDNGGEADIDPAFLYGPVEAVKLADSVSLTGLLLYGEFDMNHEEDGGTDKVKRYDTDIALNYNMSRYFKIFGGLKNMAYTFDGGDHMTTGPAAGAGVTVPLFDSVYFLANISGMYTWGEHDDRDGKMDISEYGINTSASLAYYHTPWAVTAALGGRYQYFKTDGESGGDMTHSFYGITASLIKSF